MNCEYDIIIESNAIYINNITTSPNLIQAMKTVFDSSLSQSVRKLFVWYVTLWKIILTEICPLYGSAETNYFPMINFILFRFDWNVLYFHLQE